MGTYLGVWWERGRDQDRGTQGQTDTGTEGHRDRGMWGQRDTGTKKWKGRGTLGQRDMGTRGA